MEKLNGETKDILKENIEKMKNLFPEVFTEDKMDFEKLEEVLGNYKEENEERYNFTWNGKKDAIRLSQTPTTGTLRPDKENSKNFDETENLYIEGDNLEVLKLLQKSYHNKVKMIYIDPPYNTGKDFVYKDNFKDNMKNYLEYTGQTDEEGKKTSTNSETSGRYHTDWLNMMYPRLRLARNLLTDDGVIFISIDDNEVHNLRKICDEIFGEDNFVANMVVNKSSQIATENTVNMHEYILIYSKDINKFKLGDNFKYTISRGTVGNFNQTTPKIRFPKGLNCYGIADGVYKNTRKIEGSKENVINHNEIIVKNNKLMNDIELSARWRSSNDMRNFFKNNCKPTKAKINGFIEEIYFENDRFNPQIKKRVRVKIDSLFLKNKRGSTELNDINLNIFDNPKNVNTLKKIITTGGNKDSIILDFFSGSSTTAHATMKINAEDDGNRKFIMVQLPEETDEKSEAYKAGYKTIADIGRERIRRAGEKIKEDNKDKESIEDLDIGFKSFKLDSSNIKEWNPEYLERDINFEDLINNFVEDRSEEDILYEIILKYGIDLTTPIEEHKVDEKTIYDIGFGSLYICLDKNIGEEVVEKIIELKNNNDTERVRVVFRDTGFKNDQIKLNAELNLKNNGIDEVVSV